MQTARIEAESYDDRQAVCRAGQAFAGLLHCRKQAIARPSKYCIWGYTTPLLIVQRPSRKHLKAAPFAGRQRAAPKEETWSSPSIPVLLIP
ncbi:hypothetical protein GCM10009080_11570 [Cupriavidus pauculus]